MSEWKQRLVALFVAGALAILVATSVAWPQDLVEAEADAAEDEVVPAWDAAFEVDEDSFDQWVFGGGQNAGHGRKRLDALLRLHVDSIERVCTLSELQQQKLFLAGRGDIERFLDKVEQVREKFLAVRRDQEQFNQIWQDIQPLQTKLQTGIFDHQSLWYKVLKRNLRPEQTSRYEQVEFDRRKFRYEAKVAMAVTMLEPTLALRDEQRQKFIKLLIEETQPLEAFGQYDYYAVMFQAASLPEEKLKPIFDDMQWRTLSRQLANAKGMEETLRANQIIR